MSAARLDEEQEVDLSSAWQRLKVRWWLPVGGLVVGAIVGIALALSGGSVWRAQTIVYLGQPFAPLGGGQIQSLATNPRTVGEIIRSESVLKNASRRERHPGLAAPLVDLDAGAPRSRADPRDQPAHRDRGQGLRQAQGRAGGRRARRPRHRARLGVRHGEGRAAREPGRGRPRRSSRQSRRASLGRRSSRTRSSPTSRSRSTQRLLLTANLNAVITTADARRAALQDDLFEARQLLNLAENVESSRVVEPAAASKTTARSSRSSLLVGRADRPPPRRDRRARRRPDRRPATRGGAASGLMLEGKRVAVVVPAFDEERLVGETIRGIPEFVDRIFVVDDASRDGTAAAAEGVGDARVQLVRHERNAGVGAAIATGYRRALEEEIDVTCVMAADNQMDPAELRVAGRARRARRGRVREGEPARLGRGVEGHPAHALPRERRPLAPDEDRVRLLARRRLAGGLHGALARRSSAPRPRRALSRATASRTTCSST